MAMIDNDTIHFFDRSGNDVQRDILTLPDVFVINFIDGENRAFYLVEEKECITQGCLYVINKENKVIFTSVIEDAYNVNNIEQGHFFEGVVSRKKQMLPPLIELSERRS